ncbi:ImmA/IrrE family metallo-endopeptidase [Streptomyces fulvoviolaceus]|uniref:ImmA/IrrE family metallo-endopeptidase n=1 Tax=Streptomyces fulvoviolaceus TaxID=285535 RepID=UPI0004C9177E|nr:ImmA/IrrE family metallo-endopeptidase [Streptomyces fulvoviolaceus]
MNYLRRAAARAQATAMLTVLEREHPGAAQQLGRSALDELRQWPGLDVRDVPDDRSGNGCSVSGAYFAGTPAVLAVASSASLARRDFTGLHEFGHHLQQTMVELMDVLLAEHDGGTALEDAACDAFAADILLPDTLVDRHITAAGPTADAAVELWRASNASRMATCVKTSERLPAPGHILLLDRDGTLAFGASHGLPPLRRGSDQSHIPVLRTALSGQGHAEGRGRLAYRDGAIAGEELYLQTADVGGYVLAVAVTDLAPWKTFAPSVRYNGPEPTEYTCAHCGEDYTSYARACARCESAPCPDCGRCGCDRKVSERQCTSCFVVHPTAMFDGASSHCRDCD